MRRLFLVLSLAMGVMVCLGLLPLGPLSAQEKDAGPDLKKLAEARVEAAFKAHNVAMRVLQAGRAGVRAEDVYTWSVRGLNAQLELSSKKADRISALDDHLQRMQDLAKIVDQLKKAGTGSVLDPSAAEFYLREAELWLARAKAPAKKEDKPLAADGKADHSWKERQEKAIAAIKRLGGQTATSPLTSLSKQGEVILENLPGKPVVLVYLEETKVTDADLAILKAFPDLVRLDLTTTSITDAGLKHLTGLTKLEVIGLARTKVTDKGLENLNGLVNVKDLYLRQTKVGDPGLVHLKNLKQLDFLVLDTTQVTDAGLVHLKDLTKLTLLLLDNTKITDAGLAHLEGLPKLQFLGLGGTKVTDEGFKNLRKALPKLELAR